MTGGQGLADRCGTAVKTMLESPRKVNRCREKLDEVEPMAGTSEMEKFVRCVAKPEDFEWLMEFWKTWFTALVAYQYDGTPRSCQITPILCASQGMGKSTLAFKILEPLGLHPSTFIGFPDLSN